MQPKKLYNHASMNRPRPMCDVTERVSYFSFFAASLEARIRSLEPV